MYNCWFLTFKINFTFFACKIAKQQITKLLQLGFNLDLTPGQINEELRYLNRIGFERIRKYLKELDLKGASIRVVTNFLSIRSFGSTYIYQTRAQNRNFVIHSKQKKSTQSVTEIEK
jgi:hypothetical protein